MIAKFQSPAVVGHNDALHPVVGEFAQCIDGVKPSDAIVAMAARILRAAIEKTSEPEFSIGDDGALSLDLRLSNGLRMLAELSIDGGLDVGVYDDRDSERRAREVEYHANATADDLIALL